jgi:thiamine transport system substrate-binding protein
MPLQGDCSSPCLVRNGKGTKMLRFKNQRTKKRSLTTAVAFTILVLTTTSLSGLSAAQASVKVINKIRDVTLVTHDSFVMSKALIEDFDKTTGYHLNLIKAGDVGGLTNRLILTKGTPIADAVFGIDNTFAGLAQSNGLIEGSLKAIDFGDVSFNYDKLWFANHKIVPPTSVKQLINPIYKGLTVIENPNTSSTGLSFLATSVELFGASGWQSYWKSLKENGVKVTAGWEDAYYVNFSGSSGKGPYPIVLSYASSPADEVRANGQSQTTSIMDGFFRQTEYAGVLKNAKNPLGAAAVIKYLLGPKFQKALPQAMYMYPIVKNTSIPEKWKKFTTLATRTYGDTLNINANRKSWLAQWSAIFK